MATGYDFTIAILDNDPLLLDFESHAISRLYPRERLLWATADSQEAIDRCCAEPMTDGRPETAGDGDDADEVISDCPDVLLVDMSMGNVSGPEVCKAIRERNGRTALVGVTSYSLNYYAQDALIAGAQCLIDKSSLTRIMHAAQAVLSGDYLDATWNDAPQGALHVPVLGRRVLFDGAEGIVSRESIEQCHARLCQQRNLAEQSQETAEIQRSHEAMDASHAAQNPEQSIYLTKRELQSVMTYVHGKKVLAVASALDLSESSVKTYMSRARKRLGVETNWELILLLKENGFDLDLPDDGAVLDADADAAMPADGTQPEEGASPEAGAQSEEGTQPC